MRDHWRLDSGVIFLNHGSFGATPRRVLEYQQQLRETMEREPVRFMTRELEPLLDQAREELARFVGAEAASLAFIPNATTGVNAVLRSIDLAPGDQLVVTTHEYNACRNALDSVAGRTGAEVREVDLPLPLRSPDAVVERILDAVTARTRLILIDHVTSQTAVVMPVERVIAAAQSKGIDVLVDGAHAPGMLPLNLAELGAAYYTGNLHKWVCAPKGAAFLYVSEHRRESIRPLVVSHGASAVRRDRSRFLIEFDWCGTFDPTPWLSVPEAIRTIGSLVEGGWAEVMRRNRELALTARRILCEALDVMPSVPEEMIGSMAIVELPDSTSSAAPATSLYGDPLQDRLLFEHAIEVPVIAWPAPPRRLLRVSAQIYNSAPDYHSLASALLRLLGDERILE